MLAWRDDVLSQSGADGASITRFGLQSGFSNADVAYFARLFRRRFGVTPSRRLDAAMRNMRKAMRFDSHCRAGARRRRRTGTAPSPSAPATRPQTEHAQVRTAY
ncbi:hypothetical protein [Burkholderia metallica]|uniref:hypothetical protein n=1 Tax=Burkholderia metallica TaxID=488729 RepID=UPI0015828F95|nr:hypothetical protein [Burkholderia metallica]